AARRQTLVGIGVRKEDEAAFRKEAIPSMKKRPEEHPEELLTPLKFSEGKTDKGNPYALWKVQAKADKDQAVFVAHAVVWCPKRGITVSLTLESPLRMSSKLGREAELEFYEQATKAIFFSVEYCTKRTTNAPQTQSLRDPHHAR